MQTTFIPLRVFFEKRGRIKYISHLDTMRSFTRALDRSRLPLWFTEGFNPHLYITFALPLPLGYEALCESFDVRLTWDSGFIFQPSSDDINVSSLNPADVVSRINECLPLGFHALRVAAPIHKPSVIKWADYKVHLHYDSATSASAASAMQNFVQRPSIEVLKRTKKGETFIDIKPHMRLVSLVQKDESIELTLRLAAGINLNIAATLYLWAFHEYFGKKPTLTQITRLRLLDSDLNEFE